MNHRQWKKNFKKEHGRNPSIFEDKKKADYALVVALKEMDIQEIVDNVCNALKSAVEVLRECIANIGQSLVDTFGKANDDGGKR